MRSEVAKLKQQREEEFLVSLTKSKKSRDLNFVEFVRKQSSKEKNSKAFASKIDDILSSDAQKEIFKGSDVGDLISSEIDIEIFGGMEETTRSKQEIYEENKSSVYDEKKVSQIVDDIKPLSAVKMGKEKDLPNNEKDTFIVSDSEQQIDETRLKKCLHCDKSFPTQSKLRHHKSSVHDGVKPYPCDICGKGFTALWRLKDHISNVHERKKSFECSSCGYKSGMKGNMKKHIDGKHYGEDVEMIFLRDKDLKCNL